MMRDDDHHDESEMMKASDALVSQMLSKIMEDTYWTHLEVKFICQCLIHAEKSLQDAMSGPLVQCPGRCQKGK